jgi:hypothetical protein
VDLKLIAAQDVGGRDVDLFDDILIDKTECADHVAEVAINTLKDSPGAQLLTDQGTPYMAEKAREVYEQLQAEHAPQKEADPQGKATVERAFLTAKTILAPFFALTNNIAASVPAFADSKFSIAVTTLMMTMMLRAYQSGARAARRACEVRGDIDIQQLTRAAQQHRERARADDTSARHILSRVHTTLNIDGTFGAFDIIPCPCCARQKPASRPRLTAATSRTGQRTSRASASSAVTSSTNNKLSNTNAMRPCDEYKLNVTRTKHNALPGWRTRPRGSAMRSRYSPRSGNPIPARSSLEGPASPSGSTLRSTVSSNSTGPSPPQTCHSVFFIASRSSFTTTLATPASRRSPPFFIAIFPTIPNNQIPLDPPGPLLIFCVLRTQTRARLQTTLADLCGRTWGINTPMAIPT